MKVREIMSEHVQRCRTRDSLQRAAELMWEHDRGALPVVDDAGHTVAMVTDRDVCMAAYTQGKPLRDIPVMTAASRDVCAVGPDDPVEAAQALMAMHRVARLPVIDRGGNLVGIVSLADMVRPRRTSRAPGHPLGAAPIAATLVAVFRPHDPRRHAVETREPGPRRRARA